MTILEMSTGGALLIAVILILRRAALYRLPKWTFLLLWAVALCRLLTPVTLPSQLSVYTGAARVAQALEREEVPVQPEEELPVVLPPVTFPGTFQADGWTPPAAPVHPSPSQPQPEPVSPVAAVYLTGAALCALFFVIAYVRGLRRFHRAEPVEQDFVLRWQKEHPTLLPVRIKTCEAVSAPLAYGLLRPVILLPEDTDWSDEDQLTYIFTHEYVHIRRGDLFWKLLLTAALCLHWFNPLVWVMYFRANQDLELACDERVVRILGLDSRKRYACALLSAAESGFSPLCLTYTTKNHMEERIRAIMKIKKQSLAAILAAALLVTGVTAVFATSKAPPKDIDNLPQAVMTNTDPRPASGDKSAPEDNRVHPVTPGDTSAPVTPVDTSAPDDRVHPVTGQPGDTQVSFNVDDPVEFWGIPEGPIAAGTVLNAHNVDEFKEMIRELRMMGYDGSFSLIGFPDDGRGVAILGEDYDGARRTIKVPEGIMPDWTYPVNTKGETYGTFGMNAWLGYNPDLIAVQATNGATGYMEYNYGYTGVIGSEDYREWLAAKPNPFQVPVYDVNRDNIVGYFEVGHQVSSEVQEKIDKLKGQENRWGVPEGEIPEGTEFTVADFDDADALGKYLEATHGLYPGDYTPGCIRNVDGIRYIVQVNYRERAIRERLPDGVYPVNRKGETYGTTMDHIVVGYDPDLILVQATNGKTGYAFEHDMSYGGYPGEIITLEDARTYMEWLETQPKAIFIPVYNVDRDNIIGYFKLSRSSDMTPAEELKMVEDQMRRNMGLSEEEIARELEALKQFKGWN